IDAILALEPAFLVHCVQATPSDLNAIADAGVPVVVCPRSNAHYGLKTPVDRMRAAGVALAVGSDNGMLGDGNVLADLALLHGWFAPHATVAAWLARHVTCPALDDLLLSHPLYSHTTKLDGRGRSLMGAGRLAHWAPGLPTLASLAEPPFRPGDRQAPPVNRE